MDPKGGGSGSFERQKNLTGTLFHRCPPFIAQMEQGPIITIPTHSSRKSLPPAHTFACMLLAWSGLRVSEPLLSDSFSVASLVSCSPSGLHHLCETPFIETNLGTALLPCLWQYISYLGHFSLESGIAEGDLQQPK